MKMTWLVLVCRPWSSTVEGVVRLCGWWRVRHVRGRRVASTSWETLTTPSTRTSKEAAGEFVSLQSQWQCWLDCCCLSCKHTCTCRIVGPSVVMAHIQNGWVSGFSVFPLSSFSLPMHVFHFPFPALHIPLPSLPSLPPFLIILHLSTWHISVTLCARTHTHTHTHTHTPFTAIACQHPACVHHGDAWSGGMLHSSWQQGHSSEN